MHIKTMSATSDEQVFFEDKTAFFFQDIAHVQFNKAISQSNLEAFQRSGVRVVMGGEPVPLPAASIKHPIPVTNPLTDSERITQLERSLEAFRRHRGTGKAIQVVGALTLGAYFLMNNSYVNDVKKGQLDAKAPSTVIPIVGCAIITIGFAIDGTVGDNLSLK